MRFDSIGLFWEEVDQNTEKRRNLLAEENWIEVFSGFWAEQLRLDNGENPREICLTEAEAYATAKAARTTEKCQPPEPVWLAPDYLPGLEEALKFPIGFLTEDELITLAMEQYTKGKKHVLVYDIECYGNFFFIAFLSTELNKIICLELSDDALLDRKKLEWIFENFCVAGFNSINYDLPIARLAINGASTSQLKSATNDIIEFNMRPYEVLRAFKIKKLKQPYDHIDIKEVLPLFGSLKIYGGRNHSQKMQDLPFPPDTVLNPYQRQIVRWYCVNDLKVTSDLFKKITPQLNLRSQMSDEYGLDLRSKSDAQIAEYVIGSEIKKLTGYYPKAPEVNPGEYHHYVFPDFLKFSTPLMHEVCSIIYHTYFIVGDSGNIGLPNELKNLKINIGNSTYKLGIGGLHSNEKKAAHFSDERYTLYDKDVTSYYPAIVLNLGLYPEQMGKAFLTVYESIVNRRVTAKHNHNKTVADSLKIVVNGAFGKLGNAYSSLYAPELLIQVTLTGQLSLLMLIERLELSGIPVVSANTDGIVIKCPNYAQQQMQTIVAQWERDTGFETEENIYWCLLSRDVNNYIAVKPDKEIKTKGIFADPGLSKNPQNVICVEAIKKFLIENKPIEETIIKCTDIKKFLTVRTVNGGAVKLWEKDGPGDYLGKAIRWYYGKEIPGTIVYAKSGNKVPRSEGAVALMELTDTFPDNVNHNWYIEEAYKLLKQSGYPL